MKVLIKKTPSSLLSKLKILFWVSIGLLHLSFKHFPEIYYSALETVEEFVLKGEDGLMKTDDFSEFDVSKQFKGLLHILISSLFNGPLYIQQKSFSVLLSSWTYLKHDLVDHHKIGLFYTQIYTVVWIIRGCSNLKAAYTIYGSESNVDILSVIKKFKKLVISTQSDTTGNVLKAFIGKDSGGIDSSFDSIIEQIEKQKPIPVEDSRIEKLLFNLYRLHLPAHIKNLTDFLIEAISFVAEFRPAVVVMINSLWNYSKKFDPSRRLKSALEDLVQNLPFVCSYSELEVILPQIFLSSARAALKDIDLTCRQDSPIRKKSLKNSEDSIQAAGDWLKSLGVTSSNKFFNWE